jgi:hypothetical protein
MTSEFTVRYTKPLVRTAVVRFWRRAIGWGPALAVAALGVFVVREVSLGDRSWSIGAFGTVAGIGVIVFVGSLAAQYRHHMAAFQTLEIGKAKVSVSDETLRLSSANGTSEFPWRLIHGVWRYPELWLLVFSRNSFATLPVVGVPLEALETVERNVQLAGGRVA